MITFINTKRDSRLLFEDENMRQEKNILFTTSTKYTNWLNRSLTL